MERCLNDKSALSPKFEIQVRTEDTFQVASYFGRGGLLLKIPFMTPETREDEPSLDFDTVSKKDEIAERAVLTELYEYPEICKWAK